jgi:cell wall-associated NlpC family hydrolase
MPRPAPRRPLRAAALLVVAGLLLGAGPLGTAALAADHQVFPSRSEVDASKARSAAAADQVGQIEAQLAGATARADQLATDVAEAVEAFNGARVRLAAAEDRARAAQEAARRARQQVEAARVELGRFAAAAYRSGGDLGDLSAFLFAASPGDLISRMSALQSVGDSRRTALEGFRSAQAYATVLDHRAAALVVKRRAAARQVARAKAAAEARLATQRSAVAQISQQRGTLIRRLAELRHTTVRLERARQAGLERARQEALRRAAEAAAREAARRAEAARAAAAAKAAEEARAAAAEKARREADARRAAEAQAAANQGTGSGGGGGGAQADATSGGGADPSSSGGGGDNNGGNNNGGNNNGGGASAPPAPDPTPSGSSSGSSSGAQAAIDFARSQLGKPYQWGADGPSTYDCSGLTMRAWQQGGVGLPHYSVAQYEQAQKIGLDQLRPGDLVFFASSSDYRSIYHVGLYLGDGQMIEAPYTGENVRISSIWRSSLFGAARP